MEESGSEEREIFKLLESDWLIHKLPIRIDGEKLKDEFVWISEKIVVLKKKFLF